VEMLRVTVLAVLAATTFHDAALRVSTLARASTHARGKARRPAKELPTQSSCKVSICCSVYVTMIMSVAAPRAVLTRAHVATRFQGKTESAMGRTACCNSGKCECLNGNIRLSPVH